MADFAAAVQSQTAQATGNSVQSADSPIYGAGNKHTMTQSYQQLCMAQMLNGAVLTEAARRMQYYQYHLAQKSSQVQDEGTNAQLAYAHTQVAYQLKYMMSLEEEAAAILTKKASVVLDPRASVAANATNEETKDQTARTVFFQQQQQQQYRTAMANQITTAYGYQSRAPLHGYDVSIHRPQQLGRNPQSYHGKCHYFTSQGYCRHGDSCAWFHPELPVLNEDNLPVRSPDVSYCVDYWLTGVCDAGPTCPYNHSAGARNSIRQPIRPKASLCPDGSGCKQLGRCTYNHLEPVRNELGILTDSNLNKCFEYVSYRTCGRGVACPYDHSEPELNSLNLPIRSERPVCQMFERTGNCAYAFNKTHNGAQFYCKYNHPEVFVRDYSQQENAGLYYDGLPYDAAMESTSHENADTNYYACAVDDDTVNNNNHLEELSGNTTDTPDEERTVLTHCEPKMSALEPSKEKDVLVPADTSVILAYATKLGAEIQERTEQTTQPVVRAKRGIMCEKFVIYGVCPFGNNCTYDHEPLSEDKQKLENVTNILTCSTVNSDLSNQMAAPKGIDTVEESVAADGKCADEKKVDATGNSVSAEWISANQMPCCAEQSRSTLNIVLGDKDDNGNTTREKKNNVIWDDERGDEKNVMMDYKDINDNMSSDRKDHLVQDKDNKDNNVVHDCKENSMLQDSKENKLWENKDKKENNMMQDIKENMALGNKEQMKNIVVQDSNDNVMLKNMDKKGRKTMWDIKENMMQEYRDKKENGVGPESKGNMARENKDNNEHNMIQDIKENMSQNSKIQKENSLLQDGKDNVMLENKDEKDHNVIKESKENAAQENWDNKEQSVEPCSKENIAQENKDNTDHDVLQESKENMARENKENDMMQDIKKTMAPDNRDNKENSVVRESKENMAWDNKEKEHHIMQESKENIPREYEDKKDQNMTRGIKEDAAQEYRDKREDSVVYGSKSNTSMGNKNNINDPNLLQGSQENLARDNMSKKDKNIVQDNEEATRNMMQSIEIANENITCDDICNEDNAALDDSNKENVTLDKKDNVVEGGSTKRPSDVIFGTGNKKRNSNSGESAQRTRWSGTLTTWTGFWGFIECSDLGNLVFISEDCCGIGKTKTHMCVGAELSFGLIGGEARLMAKNVEIKSLPPSAKKLALDDADNSKSRGKTKDGRYIGVVVEWQRYWGLIQTCALRDFVYCHASSSENPLNKSDKVTFALDNRIPEVLKAVDVKLLEFLPDSPLSVETRVDKEQQSVFKYDQELPACTTSLCRQKPTNPSRQQKVGLSPPLDSSSPLKRKHDEKSDPLTCALLDEERMHWFIDAPRKKRRRCSSNTEPTQPSQAKNAKYAISTELTADTPVRENTTNVVGMTPHKEEKPSAASPSKRGLSHAALQVIIRMRRAMCTRNIHQLMEAVASAEAMKLECRELCVARTIIIQSRKRTNRLSRERTLIDRHSCARKGVKKMGTFCFAR
eukprot:GEMP01001050.1.p1 GENE.GEMP01001050.1~~GEMP01001050.1.p1  ORF type:complete len:1470 (+),score=328.55 GEMP01001050.1:148-4557(+)